MTKTYSIRMRVARTVGEIIAGTVSLALVLMLAAYLLVFAGQLNVSGGSFNAVLDVDATAEAVTKQMDRLTFDYILFDKSSGEMLGGTYQDTDLPYYEKVFTGADPISIDTVDYRMYGNAELSLVVRQPTVPEFVYPPIRKFSFNTLSFILFTAGMLMLLLWSVTRLLKEFAYNFRLIQLISLNMGRPDKKIKRSATKMTEFNTILTTLYQKDDELVNLLESERTEKKDLSFQVAALSHDVKTPLTVLKGNVELLEMTDLSEQQAEFIASINNSVDVFEKYFNAMLTYSRLLAEDKNYHETIALDDFLSELVIEAQEIMASEQVAFELDNTVSLAYFKGNQLNLDRALTNILVNAAQHAGAEKIVRLHIEEEDDYLIFKIWNSGSVFSEQALKEADKLFFTEDNGRNGGHYGIGLSFAKGVAVRHHGQLQLLNPPKGGAQVNLIIRKYG